MINTSGVIATSWRLFLNRLRLRSNCHPPLPKSPDQLKTFIRKAEAHITHTNLQLSSLTETLRNLNLEKRPPTSPKALGVNNRIRVISSPAPPLSSHTGGTEPPQTLVLSGSGSSLLVSSSNSPTGYCTRPSCPTDPLTSTQCPPSCYRH